VAHFVGAAAAWLIIKGPRGVLCQLRLLHLLLPGLLAVPLLILFTLGAADWHVVVPFPGL
jgi:hypothetical protein